MTSTSNGDALKRPRTTEHDTNSIDDPPEAVLTSPHTSASALKRSRTDANPDSISTTTHVLQAVFGTATPFSRGEPARSDPARKPDFSEAGDSETWKSPATIVEDANGLEGGEGQGEQEQAIVPARRGPGRPRKIPISGKSQDSQPLSSPPDEQRPKRKPGRPRKAALDSEQTTPNKNPEQPITIGDEAFEGVGDHTSAVAADGQEDGQAMESLTSTAKRGPGRPRKIAKQAEAASPNCVTPVKRGPGRPRKVIESDIAAAGLNSNLSAGKRGPGRPRKAINTGPANIPNDHDATPERKGPGRPRKLPEALVMISPDAANSTPVKRGPGRPKKNADLSPSADDLSITPSNEEMNAMPSVKRGPGRPKKVIQGQSEHAAIIATAPVKRGPARPRKTDIGTQARNSVDAPVKRGPGRPRKSVTFDDMESREPGSTPEPRKRGRPPKAPKIDAVSSEDLDEESEEQGDDAEDDINCIICGSGESEESNHILLCDSCNLAAHQECYNVPTVPEDDWYCRDCRPEESDSIHNALSPEPMDVDVETDMAPDIEGFTDHLHKAQVVVLENLTARRRIPLHGFNEQYTKVHQIVSQTVTAGEGNSILVIGARGCGKTTLVEAVISEVSEEHREDFHVVRLNGFIHTDDRLALREIWRQLGREMEVDEDIIGRTTNYADTLTSLLALLSHPSEFAEETNNQVSKSVVFVLDEFDLFASHLRQTLLYNLFDIAQSRKAPIAVIGVTTHVNVAESLEKRVKSRFSHRYVHMSLPRSLTSYWEICKEGLTLSLRSMGKGKFSPEISGLSEFIEYWNHSIDDMYNRDSNFKHTLQAHFYRTKSVPDFFASCVLPVTQLSVTHPRLTDSLFPSISSQISAAPDSKLHILPQLSLLELALLIAAARLDVILDTDTCTFAMAYDEYVSLTTRYKVQTSSVGLGSVSALALGGGAKVWGRDVALGAWERLVEYGLLLPAALGSQGTVGRDASRTGGMWRVDVALEEIPGGAVGGSDAGLPKIMEKWCKEI